MIRSFIIDKKKVECFRVSKKVNLLQQLHRIWVLWRLAVLHSFRGLRRGDLVKSDISQLLFRHEKTQLASLRRYAPRIMSIDRNRLGKGRPGKTYTFKRNRARS